MTPKPNELSVIGVGLPRTGTSSLKLAFEELLGGTPCYHMTSFIHEGGDYDLEIWRRALEKKGAVSKDEWVEFLQGRGFRSCVDFPPAYFFKELVYTLSRMSRFDPCVFRRRPFLVPKWCSPCVRLPPGTNR